MRMSPDYLIIGEVRDGWAAMALFRALMTGHSGACTFHADTPRETFERLATLMGSDKEVRPRDSARVISSSVDLLVQIGIRHEARRVTTIANVAKELKGGEVWFTHLWRYDEDSPPGEPAWKKIDMHDPGCADSPEENEENL
jgi:pilus assembly protein CpaF